MTTVIQFYNLLKGDSNDRFEAMWEKIVGSDFYYFYIFLDRLLCKLQNIQISEKFNHRKIVAYLFCTT